MRKIQFLMMLLLMVITASNQVYAQKVNNDEIPTNDPIYLVLLGESETDFPRAISLPFEAFVQDGQLTIGSLSDLSDVTVTLSRDEAVVYTQTRDFGFMDTLVIPVSGYPEGEYLLLLTTPRGTYVYGTFRL